MKSDQRAFISGEGGATIFAIRNLEINESSGIYCGHVSYANVDSSLDALIKELEDLVEHQSFAKIEAAQSKIDDLNLKITFPDARSYEIRDLYVASDGGIAFRLRIAKGC